MPSPAMAVAIAALVVALAGTGWAAINLPKNSVGPKQLKRGAVSAAKLKSRAVRSNKLGPKAVVGSKLADGAVGESNLTSDLLEALSTVRHDKPRTHELSANTPGSCGAGSSSDYAAADVPRLIFYSYSVERSGANSSDYTVRRPGGNVTFTINGPGSESGEGFFVLPAGESATTGINIQNSDCTGGGGTLRADYYPLELTEDLPDPGEND